MGIEACKPARNDLKSCQVHGNRNDPFVNFSGIISRSKTKKYNQTLQKIGYVQGKGHGKVGQFHFSKTRRPQTTRVFPSADAAKLPGKKKHQESSSRGK